MTRHKAPLRKQQRSQPSVATDALESAACISDDQLIIGEHHVRDFAGQNDDFAEVGTDGLRGPTRSSMISTHSRPSSGANAKNWDAPDLAGVANQADFAKSLGSWCCGVHQLGDVPCCPSQVSLSSR